MSGEKSHAITTHKFSITSMQRQRVDAQRFKGLFAPSCLVMASRLQGEGARVARGPQSGGQCIANVLFRRLQRSMAPTVICRKATSAQEALKKERNVASCVGDDACAPSLALQIFAA